MAFVKANVYGDKLSVDLSPQESEYVQWVKDEQGVLVELSEMLTQYIKERWKFEAADRLASVALSDQGTLRGILVRADQELKESRKPVKEQIAELPVEDEKVKGKA